jgi:hypothetical protein
MAKALPKASLLFSLLVLGTSNMLVAWTFDNQYFPFGPLYYFPKFNGESMFDASMFAVVTNRSRGPQVGGSNGSIGSFELFGAYDLNEVARALELTGRPNPLRSQWRGNKIPYRQRGHIEMEGLSLLYQQALGSVFSFGSSIFFASLRSRPELLLISEQVDAKIIGPGDYEELDRTTRIAATELGLTNFASRQLGWGDIDVYLRAGHIWDYPYKFRRIAASAWLGGLFPSGNRRHIDQPYSLPFAGDGYWGVYLAGDLTFEVKEDITAGFLLRASKRFSEVREARVPALAEPINYGAITGQFGVDPGWVIIFTANILFEDVREGLGFGVTWQMVKKFCDHWMDLRADKTVPANLAGVVKLSQWHDEHLTFKMIYDFNKNREERRHSPILYFYWDFPIHGLDAVRVAEANRIVVGLQVPF